MKKTLVLFTAMLLMGLDMPPMPAKILLTRLGMGTPSAGKYLDGSGRWMTLPVNTGPQGIQGVAGIPGRDGTDGKNGTNGVSIVGSQGPTGAKGDKGDKGDTGTGLPGTNGTNGKDGVGTPGKDGTNGVNGTNGSNGLSASISINSVSTLASGSLAFFTNIGTATNAVYNVGIPAGKDGTNGINGKDGKDGANGSNGTNGSTGATGLQGIPGTSITGPTGPAGKDGTSAPTNLTVLVNQSLPALAVGGLYSFTVSVPGSTTGMVSVCNYPTGLLDNLSNFSTNIESNGIVTVRLKAGLVLGASTKPFLIYVLR